MECVVEVIFLVGYREEKKLEIEVGWVLKEGEVIDIELEKRV